MQRYHNGTSLVKCCKFQEQHSSKPRYRSISPPPLPQVLAGHILTYQMVRSRGHEERTPNGEADAPEQRQPQSTTRLGKRNTAQQMKHVSKNIHTATVQKILTVCGQENRRTTDFSATIMRAVYCFVMIRWILPSPIVQNTLTLPPCPSQSACKRGGVLPVDVGNSPVRRKQ